jgi:hypothetical protein
MAFAAGGIDRLPSIVASAAGILTVVLSSIFPTYGTALL